MAIKQLVHPARFYAWLTANATSTTLTVSTSDAQWLSDYQSALDTTLYLLVGTWVTRDRYLSDGTAAYKSEIVQVSSIDTGTGVITVASAMTNYADYTTGNYAFVSTNLVYDGAMQMWDVHPWDLTGQTDVSFEFAKTYLRGEFFKGPLRFRFGAGSEITQGLALPASTAWALSVDSIGKSGFTADVTKLLTIANVNDVFVYDTRRDTEPDEWRSDTSYSWQSAYGDFPVVAAIVATDSTVEILDASDGSTWATFQQGSGYALGSDTDNNPTSVFALNGKVWVGMTGSSAEGLFELDFTQDKVFKYNTTARYTWSGNLGSPNTSGTWGSPNSNLALDRNYVAYIRGIVTNGKELIFGAFDQISSDSYLFKLNVSDGEYSSTSTGGWAYACVHPVFDDIVVGRRGNCNVVRILKQDLSTVVRTYKPTLPVCAASFFPPGVPDTTIVDLYVLPNVGFFNRYLIAAAPASASAGLSILSYEPESTNGGNAVIYVKKDYATLPQIGDIRGHWLCPASTTTVADGDTIEDVSYRDADLVSVNGATVVDGPLGKAWQFNGSNQYLKQKVYDTEQGTLAYSGNDFQDDGQDFSDWETTSGDAAYMIVVTNSDSTVSWGYLGAAFTTTNTNDSVHVYTDKALTTAGWNGDDPSGKTPSSYEIRKTEFQFGSNGSFTFGCLLKLTDTTVSSGIVKRRGGASVGFQVRFDYSSGKVFFYGDSGAFAQSVSQLQQNVWYFLCVTFDGSNAKVYLNGKAGDTQSLAVSDSYHPFVLASEYNDSDAMQLPLHGLLSHPFITAEALTEEQIRRMWLQIKATMRLTDQGYSVGLGGTSNNVKAVAANGDKIFVGTADGVSVLSANHLARLDYYDSSKLDDSSNAFDATDVVSLSAGGGVLAIAGSNGTTTKVWIETQATDDAQWRALVTDETNLGLPSATDFADQGQKHAETALALPSDTTSQKVRLYADSLNWASWVSLTRNLFPNPGFEQMGEDWTEVGSPTVDWAPERPHSGLNCLAVKGDSSNFVQWDISVVSGKWYTFTAWADAESGNTATVALNRGGDWVNLVVDGDMEDAGVTNWADYVTPTTKEKSTAKVHGGAQSLHLVTDSTNYEGAYQEFNVVAGQQYTVSVWVYVASGVAGFAVGQGSFGGNGGVPLQTTSTTGQWVNLSSTFSPTVTGVYGIWLTQGYNTPSEFYVDDVVITEVGDADKTLTVDGGTSQNWRKVGTTFKATSDTLSVRFYGTDTAKEAYLDDVVLEPVVAVDAPVQEGGSESESYVADRYGNAGKAIDVMGGDTLTYAIPDGTSGATGTIAGWFKMTYAHDDYQYDAYLFEAPGLVRCLYDASEEKFVAQAYNGSNWTTVQQVSAPQRFDAGTWLHVAVAWDANGGLDLQVDGHLWTNTTTWSAQSAPSTVYVGSDGSGANQLDGAVSDFLWHPNRLDAEWLYALAVHQFEIPFSSPRHVSGAKFYADRVYFNENAYVEYDEANDRYLFYINGNVIGYVDSGGFHNGAP